LKVKETERKKEIETEADKDMGRQTETQRRKEMRWKERQTYRQIKTDERQL
jgi:hypothetical protein